MAIRDATPADLEVWDRRMVHGPGGHVYQSTAWAGQRERLGWRPRFVMLDDEHGALVLARPFPLVGGSSAYIPRGPVADPTRESAHAIAERTIALADWVSGQGVDVIATDAETRAEGHGAQVAARLAAAGFRRIPEIQPSRHRVSLALAADTDDAAVRAGFTKSTRQRVKAAEQAGVEVHRHDTAGWDGGGPEFTAPARSLDAGLGDFATLLEGTGQRLGFRFGPRQVFIDWWRAAHAAGLLVYLEAREADRFLGGLILYRHGERLSTVHSADAPGIRGSHPGVMHLLRWRAIQLAIREGRTEMDLGGVDVPPDHREPGDGDAMAGLYEHKRSFGASWVEMIGAHELVTRPWRYAFGRLAHRAARIARR